MKNFGVGSAHRKFESQYAAEANQANNELMFKVVERYFKVLEAHDELSFVQSEKISFQKKFEQIQKKFAKQLAKITDMYAGEARLDQLSAEQIMAEARLSAAKKI